MTTHSKRKFLPAFILLIAVFHPAWLLAQVADVSAVAVSAKVDASAPMAIRVLAGRSAIVDTGSPITRVSLTSADIADALVTSASQLLVHGKTPGTISMFVWSRAGVVQRYEVSVQRDVARVAEQIHNLFPKESIAVESIGRVTTQQFPAPGFEDLKSTKDSGAFGAAVKGAEGKFSFSDFLNLFLFSEKYDLGLMVKALQARGLFQSLAEPNLVAESGKEASFLAGGEFPIPVLQGNGANMGITVQFKEFGIRLNFTPTVLDGDRV